jgi:hypothetical protein
MTLSLRTLALVVIVLLGGCAGDVKGGGGASGLATASALVVALPLIPFAGAYHAVSGDVRKDAERLEQTNQELDPIYQKRIAIIESLNPTEGAERVHNEGIEAFLPQQSDMQIYPGLKNTDVVDSKANANKILGNEFLRYLQTLMDDDPIQKNERYSNYYSPTFKRFRHLGSQYKASFNIRIRQLAVGA